jgi:hypothetical protein
MMQIVILLMYLLAHAPEQREATERLAPRGWQGNFWGPSANQDRREGKIPKVPMTPVMTSWQNWGKQTLHDGDIVFRRGDARLLLGYFRFSRFVANADNSAFSHTGVVAIENGEPVVYDTTKAGVACQPFGVWILDNVGALGVKRLRPEHQGAVPKVLAYCRNVFQKQVPFDYELGLDDSKLYCVEMTEKAFRAAGIALSEPIALGDMERATEFPISMLGLRYASEFVIDRPLSFQGRVYFPGNDHHGVWGSPFLITVFPATDVADRTGPDF